MSEWYQCNEKHMCSCGTATHHPHEVGKDGCKRFRVKPPRKLSGDYWGVEGGKVNDFVLREQRGYSEFKCGCWSRWSGSTNSLSDNT